MRGRSGLGTLYERLRSAGVQVDDSDELQLKKQVLMFACGLMIAGSGVWLSFCWLLGLPLPATNDSHYTNKEDAEAHDALFSFDYLARTAALEIGLPILPDGALLFADKIITEDNGKKGLIGVFSAFNFPSFPATAPPCGTGPGQSRAAGRPGHALPGRPEPAHRQGPGSRRGCS